MFFLSEAWWNLPILSQMKGSIIFIATAAAIMFITFLFINMLRMKSTKTIGSVLEIGPDGKPLTKEEILEKRRLELRFVISKSIIYGGEMYSILNFDIVKDQMNMAQPKTDDIRGIMLKNYTLLLEKMERVGSVIPRTSLMIFDEFVTNIIKNKVLIEVKRAFKDDRLTEFSDGSYEDIYCRNTSYRILTNMRNDIKNRIPESIVPSIKDALDIFDRNEDKFLTILKEVFIAGREISVKYRDEMKSKTDSYEKAIIGLTSVNKEDIGDILGLKL